MHWHGLRLDNRYDGTHETQARWRSARASSTGCSSPMRACTGFTRTSARTTARRWACPAPSSSSPTDPAYWAPAHRELVVTLDDVLIEDGRIAPFSPTRRRTPRWAASATTARQRRAEPHAERRRGRGRSLLLRQHGQHPRVQRRRPRRPDEARRRRQRPLRARRARRLGDPGTVGARRSSTCASRPPARRRSSIARRSAPTAGHDHGRRRRRRPGSDDGIRHAARQPRDGRPSATAIAPYRDREPDKTIAFVAEMEFEAPEGTGRLHLPDAPRGRQRRTGQVPRVRDEAHADGRRAVAYTCPMHPDVVSDEQGRCPHCGMKLDARDGGLRGERSRRTHTASTMSPADHASARPRPRPRRLGRDRVGGRHGRGQPDDDAGEHALEADRPLDRRREPRHRLAVHASATR